MNDTENDINIDFSEVFDCIELNNSINIELNELDIFINNAKHITEMKQRVNNPSTSLEELKAIHKQIISYGFALPAYTNRIDLLDQITVSVEGTTITFIKERIMAIIKKIIDMIKNFVSINRILANLLSKELNMGVLSNIRGKTNITAFNSIISPFYNRDMLMYNIKFLSTIRYGEDIKEATTLSQAIGDRNVESLSKLGWNIKENTLTKISEKEVNLPLVRLGWKMDDLPTIARDVNVLLMNNLIEGRRVIKTLERKANETSSVTDSEILRRKLYHIQRTVSIIQDVGVTVAWCIIFLCRKIKAKQG